MKIRYKGGNIETVHNPKTKKDEKRDQLTQLLEGALYVFPKPGSVLSLSRGVAGWLMAKHPKLLELLPDDEAAAPMAAPTVFVAVIPEDAKTEPEKKGGSADSHPKPTQG